jgi:Leucine-rich repeat (LRR) protein
MKKILFSILYFLIGISNLSANTWNTYSGLLTIKNQSQEIEIKILFLDKGYIIGSYRNKTTFENYKLVGNLIRDSLKLTIRPNKTDNIYGVLLGFISKKRTQLSGVVHSTENDIGTFKMQQVFWSSYTDYLNKYRALKEYKNLSHAIKKHKKVLSIDLAKQNLQELPFVFDNFSKLLSLNLLGNNFENFPDAITEVTSLEELSLSSNGLKTVSPNLGKLKRLRILILNFNQIDEIPKEIGNLTELLYLDFGDNNLTSFPDEFKNLSKLQEIHIDDNNFSQQEIDKLKTMLPNCIIHEGHQRTK